MKTIYRVAAVLATALLATRPASAAAPSDAVSAVPPPPQAQTDQESRESPPDRTGGGYTSPTLLFVPAVAVPAWNVRLIASSEFQNNTNIAAAGARPGIGAEVGIPFGITIGAGTNWVGGDVGTNGKTDFSLGLSPYLQARLHLLGDAGGQGFQLGVAATYKFVGFAGDPGEMELAVSSQYRTTRFEVGLQGVLGQDFGAGDHDGELHAYALYRVIPELGIGAAGQLRVAIAPDAAFEGNKADALGGALASLTLGRYQAGALLGATTLNLNPGEVGALGQLFVTARF